MTLDELLRTANERHASDVIAMVGDAPSLRIAGQWQRLEHPPLRREELLGYVAALMDTDAIAALTKNREADFSRHIPGIGRIRCNAHYQRDHLALVMRMVWPLIPSGESLGIPRHVFNVANSPHGLVLISGPTGSGKSTTLAAIVEHINQHRAAHIITIEDPIEYIYQNARSIVEQREIGSDTLSWSNAIRQVLRQAPDVIVLGELRDLESIAIALTAAETGHLVLASVHASTTTGALMRIMDIFPANQIPQVRLQLSQSLRMVFGQVLLPGRTPNSRALCYEILVGTPAVQNLVRANELEQLNHMISAGREHGMIGFAQCQSELVRRGLINSNIPSVLARVG